jgi:hypothetical protein
MNNREESMKKYIPVMVALFIVFSLVSNAIGAPRKVTVNPKQTIQVSGTITQVDSASGKLFIKEKSGSIKGYSIPPQGIDLSAFKVGDPVMATVTSDPTTGAITLVECARIR